MLEPKLVVMAAGLGSRYGGLKQMENMTDEGEIILDFSCYDAIQAGFREIVFIVKPEIEELFKERVVKNIEKFADVKYAVQSLTDLPEGYTLPEGRTKPWGTCHAVLAAKMYLNSPFCVINADDYYGKDAFVKMYEFLKNDTDENTYAMAGYYVQNTLSDLGTVTRGVCQVDENSNLTKIVETKEVGWKNAEHTLIGTPDMDIPEGTVVSMNFWGFKPSFIKYMEEDFIPFLDTCEKMKGEYLLPTEVEELLRKGKCTVKVFPAVDKWYGVTYKEDKEVVHDAFKRLKVEGKYPEKLWERTTPSLGLGFGTAGIRGVMKAGAYGINYMTVRLSSMGLAKYLLKEKKTPRVLISYDTRNSSEYFAMVSALTLENMGVDADSFKIATPVPVLSYAVREGKYDAGIVITASHNPKEYNGFKVYGSNGAQILKDAAEEIEKLIGEIREFPPLRYIEPSFIDDSIYEKYYAELMNVLDPELGKNIKVLYTPLHGSGLLPVCAMLEKKEIPFEIVQEQSMPDGNFPTCPYPNPEIPDVYEIAKEYAKDKDFDIIVATDPDSDRVGCMVDGKLLSGNDIGTILTYYFSEKKKEGTVVCSLVSTPLIEKIAESFGVKAIRTDVGFKWIGDQIDQNEDFIFGFEESNGYLSGRYARDKDGVLGVLLIAEVCSYYKEKGMTLLDVLKMIDEKYGKLINRTYSRVLLPGEEKPEMLVKNFEDGSRVIVRPSGTEPKVKCYISAPSEERMEELKKEYM